MVVLVAILVCGAFYLGWLRGSEGQEGALPPPDFRAHSESRAVPITEIITTPDPTFMHQHRENETIVATEIPPTAVSAQEQPPSQGDEVTVIRHVVEPYWQERHWQPHGKRLDGFYRTPLGSFQGYVEDWQSRSPNFYIIDPPKRLRHHSHWACFRSRGNGRYWVHFGRTPSSADGGIIEIEKVLAEALSGSPRRS